MIKKIINTEEEMNNREKLIEEFKTSQTEVELLRELNKYLKLLAMVQKERDYWKQEANRLKPE